MPHLGLWVWTCRSLCHVSGSASFSEAAALFAKPGLTLLPAGLIEETQQSQLHAVLTREVLFPCELHRMKPHALGLWDEDV